jgi:hypothetical protein
VTPALHAASLIEHNPPQFVHREPFFDDERRRHVLRHRTAHRQIIHRAVHGEVADIPSWKEDRMHDV